MTIRRSSETVIAGVCGGLADHVGVERMAFRTLYTLTLVLFGLGVPLYVVLYLAMEPPAEAPSGDGPGRGRTSADRRPEPF